MLCVVDSDGAADLHIYRNRSGTYSDRRHRRHRHRHHRHCQPSTKISRHIRWWTLPRSLQIWCWGQTYLPFLHVYSIKMNKSLIIAKVAARSVAQIEFPLSSARYLSLTLPFSMISKNITVIDIYCRKLDSLPTFGWEIWPQEYRSISLSCGHCGAC